MAALGIVEIQSLANAYKVYDQVVKTSDVRLVHQKKALGGRMVTLVFEGEVSDVSVAIDEVCQLFEGSKRLKIAEVIANPAEAMLEYLKKGVLYE